MFLCAIFLSDLASANGWYFDSTRCSREVDHNGDSTYSFPREKPSQKDWEEWEAMWRRYCQRDGSFPVHLGHIQYSHLLNAKSVMSVDDWISVLSASCYILLMVSGSNAFDALSGGNCFYN